MIWRHWLPVPALAALLLFLSGPCGAAVPREPIVFFMGASETAGYGLPSVASAFPHLVAVRCGIVAIVSATPNVPTLLRQPTNLAHAGGVVMVISFIDAYVPAPRGTVRRWLGSFVSAAPTLIMTTPPIGEMGVDAPTLALKQRRLYARIDRDARANHAAHISLALPAPPTRFLQRDGIHPNALANRLIARRVEAWLGSKRLCPVGHSPKNS